MIGIAVIGLGNALQPHARGLVDLADRVRVVWAAASSEARLKDVADRYGFPTTTDVARAIADPAVDAVMVLTPANAHLPIAEAAFAAGKHVLCEKPLEVSIERGEQLIAAGRRANRRLGICLQLASVPAACGCMQVLREGALGEIQAATMMVPWWRPQSYYDEPGRGVKARDGGGVLITQAIHYARSVPLAGRHRTRRGGAGAHHRAAPHGDRGLRIRAGPSRQRRARHDRRHRRRLARQPRMDPYHRLKGHRAAGRRQPAPRVRRWPARRCWRTRRVPAAAPA